MLCKYVDHIPLNLYSQVYALMCATNIFFEMGKVGKCDH